MARSNLIKTNVDTAQGYDLWAAQYDQRPSHTVCAARQALKQLVPELTGKSILEVGCGTGENLLLMNGKGVLRATGLDFSNGMLARAKEKNYDFSTHFVQHDVRSSLPIASRSVDVVVMCLVLEHLVDLEFTFRELSRVLKPGGYSLVIEIHPFLALCGGLARFLNPADGVEYHMISKAYSVSEILNANLANHLVPERVLEVADPEKTMPSILAIRARASE